MNRKRIIIGLILFVIPFVTVGKIIDSSSSILDLLLVAVLSGICLIFISMGKQKNNKKTDNI
jgi:amino acid permease